MVLQSLHVGVEGVYLACFDNSLLNIAYEK